MWVCACSACWTEIVHPLLLKTPMQARTKLNGYGKRKWSLTRKQCVGRYTVEIPLAVSGSSKRRLHGADGTVGKYKARLIAQGYYTQKYKRTMMKLSAQWWDKNHYVFGCPLRTKWTQVASSRRHHSISEWYAWRSFYATWMLWSWTGIFRIQKWM